MTAPSAAQLAALAPHARADLIAAIVANWQAAESAGLATPRRIRHFLARAMIETGGLRAIEESVDYSVNGLMKNFGRHRISAADCRALGSAAGRPADKVAIANLIYGGAWGLRNLGNSEPGDGWRFRGGGMLQTTGRAGYRALGFEDNPEALRQPATAFMTAVKEWQRRGCNALADKGDVRAICEAINGGTNGLADQRAWLTKAEAIFPDALAPATAPLPSAPVLRRGSTGEAVAQLQRQLARAGFYHGEVDGDFGTRTQAAVIDLQRTAGFAPADIDGIAGPKTRAALAGRL